MVRMDQGRQGGYVKQMREETEKLKITDKKIKRNQGK